jgi:thiamine monophosphate synthase
LSVLALGGITADKVRSCAEAGADGVAVIRALLDCSDPGRVALALHDVWASH